MRRHSGAWTLVEMMIVVLIIGILLTIATPNFINARERSRQKACIANLRLIDGAKEQWALDYRASAGTSLTMTRLMGTYIKSAAFSRRSTRTGLAQPRCPASNLGYSFTMGTIGTPPECPTDSARTGPTPHVLP